MRFRCFWLVFVLLLAMGLLGCNIFNQGGVKKGEAMLVRKLDAVILTDNDLPTMKLDGGTGHRAEGFTDLPPIVDGFSQSWDGTQPEEHIGIDYWVFRSPSAAKKAGAHWRDLIAAGPIMINGKLEPIYQPEPSAKDVIGDATWRVANGATIWFVKNNVLVRVMARRPEVNQLTLTRSVARKIEKKN